MVDPAHRSEIFNSDQVARQDNPGRAGKIIAITGGPGAYAHAHEVTVRWSDGTLSVEDIAHLMRHAPDTLADDAVCGDGCTDPELSPVAESDEPAWRVNWSINGTEHTQYQPSRAAALAWLTQIVADDTVTRADMRVVDYAAGS